MQIRIDLINVNKRLVVQNWAHHTTVSLQSYRASYIRGKGLRNGQGQYMTGVGIAPDAQFQAETFFVHLLKFDTQQIRKGRWSLRLNFGPKILLK